MDNKYYTAVTYVGVNGVLFDDLLLENSKEEEQKNQSSLATNNIFSQKLQNLVVKSNMPKTSNLDLNDLSDLK